MTHTGSAAPGTPTAGRPDVELRLPADSAFVSVLRTTTAGLAARLDFTIDEIEDLRIAVGEASALLLEAAGPASDLHCSFTLAPGLIGVRASVDAEDPVAPDPDGFAWQVLSTLASTADAQVDADRVTITLTLASAGLG